MVRERGFTTTELMVVVAIVAVLTALAAPNMRGLIQTQRVKTASFDLFAGLVFARSEAIKRNSAVTMTPGASGWGDGWTLTDNGGTMVGKQDPFSQLTFTGPATVTFNGMGRLNGPASQFQISDTALDQCKWRCVTLDLSGRPVSSVGACGAAVGACP